MDLELDFLDFDLSDPEGPAGLERQRTLPEIMPDGDVILVVGPKKIKIQLSSHLLSSTSPVFAAMLGPNFREGNLLRESQGPVEIALPADNAKALWHIYNVLYGAHPRAHKLDTDELYNVACLAYKYDLVERLSLAREAWFADADGCTFKSTEENWKMLLAAYWLESEYGFANLSQRLIEQPKQLLYIHGMETPDQVLGLKLCLAIEELRANGHLENGLCLSCFNDPETEGFYIKNPGCPSKFGSWVLP
ncbi:hypothetical protein BHE90_004424 [Fusarium euwallaceae]|uniref:BTB domain-containing protein n=1 Tax=Fusarium euwallaceae TaxID=1147111 RepID=A0A430LZ94_9HYPO|nr:hypothetical protein BHE90_004424 [Fusarium euwallaceae]